GAGVHTGRMLAELDAHTGYVEISVGAPRFAPDEIPVRTDRLQLPADWNENTVLRNVQLDVEGNRYPVTLVSMGNPHCVLFVDDADRFALESIGPLVENHPAFPRRTNFEVVSRETYTTADGQQKERLYQRTFERGSGETLACGSGACAVHVAAVLNGISPARANIRLRGGELELEWNGSVRNPDTVFMRGPARFVFSGQLDRNVFR
ncbi:MAG: diaminopimelate epimerase, partial [Leptospiraceae bacterium]|nr:diaminopimelate epimerase [Leptospiraceae bacterium]